MNELGNLIEVIASQNPTYIATAYEGSEKGYNEKLYFENYFLSLGVNVIDCDICSLSAFSATIELLKPNFGIFFSEKEKFILNNKGYIIFDLKRGSFEKKVKKWNEIGNFDTFNSNNYYLKKINEIIKNNIKEKINKHIIVDTNFGSLSKIAPYVLRNIFTKVTTLNASIEKTYEEENIETIYHIIEAYNADLGILFDRIGYSLRIFNKEGEIKKEEILKNVIEFIVKHEKDSKIIMFNDIVKEFENFPIEYVNDEKILSKYIENNLVIINSRNISLIYPKLSKCFDSLLTFIFFYLNRFIY